MEKLQPVIRQIFWVLFGLGLILILWGWYAANSSLSASIETEKAKVETTKTGAKKNVMGTPNPDWTKKAEDLNENHQEAFDESARKLWEQQLAARVYPDLIGAEINQLRFRSKIADKSLRGIFRTLYNGYFLEQLEVIKPFKPETGLGLVDVAKAKITRENPVKWKNRLPTSQEIWNTQEDIWLVRSILDAIAETNGAADRIDKAPIRSLLQLQLRGGDPEAGVEGAGGTEGGAGGMMGGGSEMGSFASMGGGLGGSGGPRGVWSAFKGALKTDLLTEEFGPAPGAAVGMMGGTDDYGSGDDYSGGAPADGSAEGADDADSTADRYVHYGEELPYKTRAFILQVQMVQKDIPTLLASLPNGKFPVEIVRVDVDFSGKSSGASTGGIGGMGAMGGGSYGGGGDEFGGNYGGGAMGGLGMGGLGMGGAGLNGGFGGGIGKVKPKSRKQRKMASDGTKLFAMAMTDPLATVRVAGLMTIYESPEEKAAEAESENAAESEANDSTDGLPPIELAPTNTGSDLPDTKTSPEGTQTDGNLDPPTDGTDMMDKETGMMEKEMGVESPTGDSKLDPAESPLGKPTQGNDADSANNGGDAGMTKENEQAAMPRKPNLESVDVTRLTFVVA